MPAHRRKDTTPPPPDSTQEQTTPALPAPTRPKLIPVVTTAGEANAVELAQTYFRRWARSGRMRSEIGSFLSTWIRITGMRKSQW